MYRGIWKSLVFLCFVLAILVVVQQSALACPTCKSGLADGEHSNMARGYFWSILFMMSMPFFILGGLGAYFYMLVRSARMQAAADPAAGRYAEQRSPAASSSMREPVQV